MQLTPIIERLKAQLSWARKVEGAADLSRAAELQQFTADLYVVNLGERARPNQRINAHRQQVACTFAIVQWSKDASDASGGKALEKLDPRRLEIFAAIVNWQPTSALEPIDFIGGELVSFAPPGVLWSDRFETTYQLVIPNG